MQRQRKAALRVRLVDRENRGSIGQETGRITNSSANWWVAAGPEGRIAFPRNRAAARAIDPRRCDASLIVAMHHEARQMMRPRLYVDGVTWDGGAAVCPMHFSLLSLDLQSALVACAFSQPGCRNREPKQYLKYEHVKAFYQLNCFPAS